MARLLQPAMRPGHGAQALRLAPWVRQFKPRLACVPMGTGGFDAVDGRSHSTQISTVAAQRTSTQVGPAWNFLGYNNGGGLTFNSATPMVGLAWSMVALCRYRGVGEYSLGRLFSGMTRDLYPNGNGRLQMTCRFSGSYQTQDLSLPFDGVFRGLVIVHDARSVSNLLKVWVRGAVDGTVTNTPAGSVYDQPPDGRVSVGNHYINNARCMNGEVALIAFFDALLPPDVAWRLSINPWLIFAP